MSKLIEHICPQCNKSFLVESKLHNAGRNKHCSKECGYKSLKRVHEPNTECALCLKAIYRSPKNNGSKSGLRFCSYMCKNKAQALGAGFESILPPHYGTAANGSASTYRRLAFLHYDCKCQNCGWDKIPGVLDVHHIDEDRTNNDIANLKILCPTCHVVEHWNNKSGRFTKNKIKKMVLGTGVEPA